MRLAILERLKQTEDYLSGEALSQEFGVSRAAINKHIMALRNMGYEIESITNRGYRLQGNGLLNQLELELMLKRTAHPLEVEFHESIDSTNQAAKLKTTPSLIVALEQTKGKGRRGRDWISSKGQGLYFSLTLMPKLPPDVISAITQLAGLGVARAIGDEAKIKWPNDVLISGQKVSGILTELVTQADMIEKLIIGIGVNFSPVENMPTAISLQEAGIELSMIEFLERFLNEFLQAYPLFIEQPELTPWLKEINQRSFLQGKQVEILGTDSGGEFQGIDARGHAIVKGDERHLLTYGEISLRGRQ